MRASGRAAVESPDRQPRKRMAGRERKNHIARVATRMIAEGGHEALSMRQLAAASGVTPPVLYDHFSSKKDLQLHLLETQGQELVRFIKARFKRSLARDRQESLTVAVDAFFGFVEANRDAWRMCLRECPTDADIQRAHDAVIDSSTRAMTRLFATIGALRQRDGMTAAERNEILAEMMRGGINQALEWWMRHPEVGRGEIVALASDVLWSGVRGLSIPATRDARSRA